MNKSIGVAIVAAVIGGALALVLKPLLFPPEKPHLTGPCTSGQEHCKIVRVIMVAGKPQIQQISDESVNAPAVIFWEIETAGYTFPANGINFYPASTTKDPNTAAPAGEFFNCGLLGTSTTVYKCNNKHTAAGTGPFGYTVTLSGTPPVPSLDPYIINN
jgi:hypothetical protein